ncbi:hypothetical protein N431DRAFT_337227 [Stipitochalara longipes BDJ]|nr:hypothetical protein N431DRAFT_337227 [Stipitochalara longipes BDJ]
MRSLLSIVVLALTTLSFSVEGQSNIYNTTDCLATSGEVSWTVAQPRYSNSTTSIQIVGPPIGRILTMIITNNDAKFDVRCPGDLTLDPYSPKTILQASCSTDFRGYYFPPKDAVGDVWMSGSFDERNYTISFTQTWWCQENASAPLYCLLLHSLYSVCS